MLTSTKSSTCSGVAVLLAVVAATTGCATGTDNDAPPAAPPSPSPTTIPTTNVPSVENPLDISGFLNDPCTSLTDEQITEYLGSDVESEVGTEHSSGPACSWYSGMRSNAQITVTYPRLTDEGLTAIYRNRDAHAYFIETPPVAGYPAVSYGGVDLRDEGDCLVTVGTSNSDYVNIDVYLGKGSAGQLDPCDAAHEVATTVVGNIRSAQSAG